MIGARLLRRVLQLAHLEKRLHEERARVMKELGYYDESFNSSLQASDGDLSSYSFHMADQGTDAMEREKAFLFASQEGRYLWHVNQALRRLYQQLRGAHGDKILRDVLAEVLRAQTAGRGSPVDPDGSGDVPPSPSPTREEDTPRRGLSGPAVP